MKRRAVLASFAALATTPPANSAAVAGSTRLPRPFLRIAGRIGTSNSGTSNSVTPGGSAAGERAFDFSEASFLALPTSTITTTTSWTPRSSFKGPLLLTVMQSAGVSGGTLVFRTMGDYTAAMPWSDLVRYGVILAHSQDGARLSNKRWGPLWAMYPRDRYPDELIGPVAESRFIWQVNRIEVSA